MKHFLFIIGLLLSAVLFVPEEEAKSLEQAMAAYQETIMEESETSESQRDFEVLSNELKSSNFLTPRRLSQTNVQTFNARGWKLLTKHIQGMRLRGENLLHKVFEQTSIDQTIQLSTFSCRKSEHVYALRKLII